MRSVREGTQSLIQPLKCQLATQGAFFTVVEETGMPNSPQKDEMTLQRGFFRCGMDAECSNTVISATNENSEERKVTDENKKTTNQRGTTWVKIPKPVLISKGKDTKQSSLYNNDGLSSHAVDGNRDNNWRRRSCSSTLAEKETSAWWRVDVGKRAMIHNVMITNRGDCCPERLRNFTIRVGFEDKKNINPACREIVGITTGITVDFRCDTLLAGQFVYIETALRNVPLTLCEVEVYGYYF